MKHSGLLLLAVAVLAAGAGYFVAMTVGNGAAAPPGRLDDSAAVGQPSDLIGQRRPDFELADSAGGAVSAADFDGRPVLVNFWATWCAPCVEEMPMLADLQRDAADTGLRVVGIALDEPGRATAFARDMGIDYPVLVGGTETVLTGRRFGNRSGMLPYSVLVDAAGVIRWVHLGALEREVLERELSRLE